MPVDHLKSLVNKGLNYQHLTPHKRKEEKDQLETKDEKRSRSPTTSPLEAKDEKRKRSPSQDDISPSQFREDSLPLSTHKRSRLSSSIQNETPIHVCLEIILDSGFPIVTTFCPFDDSIILLGYSREIDKKGLRQTKLRLLNLATAEILFEYPMNMSENLQKILISPDGNYFAVTFSQFPFLAVFEIHQNQIFPGRGWGDLDSELKHGPVTDLAFDILKIFDLPKLVLLTAQGSLCKVWDVPSAACLYNLQLSESSHTVSTLCSQWFSVDTHIVLTTTQEGMCFPFVLSKPNAKESFPVSITEKFGLPCPRGPCTCMYAVSGGYYSLGTDSNSFIQWDKNTGQVKMSYLNYINEDREQNMMSISHPLVCVTDGCCVKFWDVNNTYILDTIKVSSKVHQAVLNKSADLVMVLLKGERSLFLYATKERKEKIQGD
eukprot:TRINITY_DN5654_c0_g1_i10.p1 TRINITY_DN5654_c0_g1~~TRINITY_DN5654_c0_g1_i10.p1  ORF type:complete len:433 (+),score=72.36 TRINITY_DN5654_c0_g1_i10:999-2297(+)